MVGEHESNITAKFVHNRLKFVGQERLQSLFPKIHTKNCKKKLAKRKNKILRVGGHLGRERKGLIGLTTTGAHTTFQRLSQSYSNHKSTGVELN